MKYVVTMLLMAGIFTSRAQDFAAYKIFNSKGKEVKFEEMIKDLGKADVVLFGELHNISLAHWFELQVTKELFKLDSNLVLGAEMFEADNQVILDEYFHGFIKESHMEKEAKMWDNYSTDYKPLMTFAKEHHLRMVATNIPRRYANLVYRRGLQALDSLSDEAKKWIAPLPITVDLELSGYQNMMKMMGGHGTKESAENLAKSQASKDATMAHFILKNRDGKRFIHYNGSYHSNDYQGIGWYLKEADKSLKIKTINTVEQENIHTLDEKNQNTANYIIIIPKDMTKTY